MFEVGMTIPVENVCTGKRREGTIVEIDSNVLYVKFDDGSIKAIEN